MNIEKHLDFFNPVTCDDDIHIIGVGAIGSHVAEQLTRLGFESITIYDFDTVESKNIANQMYFADQVGKYKTYMIGNTMRRINPELSLTIFDRGYTGQVMSGYVFLCLDNIDLRRDICTKLQKNKNIKAVFDIRMGLTDAQHYAARWSNPTEVEALLETMQFTHEEAQAAQPVSACGSTLSVIPTIRCITAMAVANFINLLRVDLLKKLIIVDAFQFEILTM